MTEVKVINGNFEQAIRRFKKLSIPILKELRVRRSFESRAQKQRRKGIEARRRKRRTEKRINEFQSRDNKIRY